MATLETARRFKALCEEAGIESNTRRYLLRGIAEEGMTLAVAWTRCPTCKGQGSTLGAGYGVTACSRCCGCGRDPFTCPHPDCQDGQEGGDSDG